MTSLHATVTTAQCNHMSIVICEQLHLQVATSLRQSHHEDRRSRDFRSYRIPRRVQFALIVQGSNALPATSLRGLYHERILEPTTGIACLLERVNGHGIVNTVGDHNAAIRVAKSRHIDGHIASVPGKGWNVGGLRDQGRVDFISQTLHRTRGGTEKQNPTARQALGKRGVFGGVTPTRPHGIYFRRLGDFHDPGHVGEVVDVGSAGNLDGLIGHTDIS